MPAPDGPLGFTFTPTAPAALAHTPAGTTAAYAPANRTHSAPPVTPGAPGGLGAGSSSGAGSGGGFAGGPGALLLSFLALALCAAYRLLLAPAAHRPAAFVSLVERPG